MKKVKSITAVALSVMMAAVCTACISSATNGGGDNTPAARNAAVSTELSDDDAFSLIASYEGNTAYIAEGDFRLSSLLTVKYALLGLTASTTIEFTVQAKQNSTYYDTYTNLKIPNLTAISGESPSSLDMKMLENLRIWEFNEEQVRYLYAPITAQPKYIAQKTTGTPAPDTTREEYAEIVSLFSPSPAPARVGNLADFFEVLPDGFKNSDGTINWDALSSSTEFLNLPGGAELIEVLKLLPYDENGDYDQGKYYENFTDYGLQYINDKNIFSYSFALSEEFTEALTDYIIAAGSELPEAEIAEALTALNGAGASTAILGEKQFVSTETTLKKEHISAITDTLGSLIPDDVYELIISSLFDFLPDGFEGAEEIFDAIKLILGAVDSVTVSNSFDLEKQTLEKLPDINWTVSEYAA